MNRAAPNLRQGIVLGHGIDIVDIQEFSILLKPSVCHHINRYFTNSELESAENSGIKIQKLAGRLAIKEAVLKALGVGWGDGHAFTDIEVITLETGAPTVKLHRQLAALAEARKIVSWQVSSSHTTHNAVGSAIALGAIT